MQDGGEQDEADSPKAGSVWIDGTAEVRRLKRAKLPRQVIGLQGRHEPEQFRHQTNQSVRRANGNQGPLSPTHKGGVVKIAPVEAGGVISVMRLVDGETQQPAKSEMDD